MTNVESLVIPRVAKNLRLSLSSLLLLLSFAGPALEAQTYNPQSLVLTGSPLPSKALAQVAAITTGKPLPRVRSSRRSDALLTRVSSLISAIPWTAAP